MRDDFSLQIKREVAARVGYRCSRASCRAATSGPHSDDSKSVNVGVAAHITAAASGGPRYAPELRPTERRSASNAIWLCQTCARLIDTDPARYPIQELRRWKEETEREAGLALGTANPIAMAVTPPEAARLALLDARFQMTVEDYKRRGSPKFMIDTFRDLSQQEKAELYDRAILWKKGRVSKNNPYL